LLAVCLLGLCIPGWAADRSVHYHIAAGSLDDVLRTFARQSGIQLLYPPAQTARLRSTGLEGEYSPQRALTALLHDSGLRAESVASDTYVLRQTPPAPLPVKRMVAIPSSTLSITLAPVEVTGTHIRRTKLETAGPLTIIDRKQIEQSGYQTLYELLRAQPGIRVNNAPVAMSDGSAYQNNGLSGAVGAAAVDLHGLGASATLFLVDGQRMAGYGLAQGEFGLVNNLNNIPLSLIDRIEVLRDGASAIYGSDAMAGVINIILRKQFDGVALEQVSGISTHGDAQQWRDTATFGTTTAGGSHMFLSLDYFARSPLLSRQRAWAVNAGRAGTGPAGAGQDFFYFDNGQINHAGVPACSQAQLNGPCTGDAAAQTSLQTGLESHSLLGHLDHPLGPLTLYMDVRWTLVRQRQQMGPATEQLQVSDPTLPAGYRDITYAFNDVGPVRDHTLSRSNQLTLGLRGTPGSWAWNLRLDGQSNRGTDRVFGLLRTSVLDQALADGSYQPGGNNQPALLARLSPQLMRTGRSTQTGFSARANGPIADWRSGPVSLAVGVESYRERLRDNPDPLLISNDVFQFQSPYVRRGDRWISAAYVELEAPVGPRLTANVAARVDHSAGFGWAGSPRLGLKWDITDSLSLRGTLARGYRAPTLPELDRPQNLTPSGILVEVPNALLPCTGATPWSSSTSLCTLRLDSIGNPDLQPERSRSVTLGLVWAPTPALGIAADAYEIHRFNEINALPVSYAMRHPDRYPQLFRRDANGVLYAFDQQLVNLGHTTVRSYDLDMHYRLETARLGRFIFNLGVDWLAELRRQVHPGAVLESYAGYAGQPRATALAGLEWSWRHWRANGNVRYTGHYAFASSSDSPDTCPATQQQANHCETPAFALFDLGLDYAGFKHVRLGLHLHNLTDHRPVFYGYPATGYSPSFDDVVGRYVLLSVRYRSKPAD
jgi:outer membrane receptor protein involved in Fe transport